MATAAAGAAHLRARRDERRGDLLEAAAAAGAAASVAWVAEEAPASPSRLRLRISLSRSFASIETERDKVAVAVSPYERVVLAVPAVGFVASAEVEVLRGANGGPSARLV